MSIPLENALKKNTAALERVAKALEHQNQLTIEIERSKSSGEDLTYDDETMMHVLDSIIMVLQRNFPDGDAELIHQHATAIVSEMQNRGILFRERA